MSESNQNPSLLSSVPRKGAPIDVPSRYSTPVGSRVTANKTTATPGARVLRSRTIGADGKATETPREPLARSRAPTSTVDSAKEGITRTRVSSIGAQGPLRRTSVAPRRTATATATSATGETRAVAATTLQPLQRRTSISTRVTSTTETKPLTRTTRASLGTQETKPSTTRSTTTTTSTVRRTSLMTKRTAGPLSTPQSSVRKSSNDIPEIQSSVRATRASIRDTPSQTATRSRLSSVEPSTRSKRTPLVTRKAPETRPMVTPVAAIQSFGHENTTDDVLTQTSKEDISQEGTNQSQTVETSPDTDFNELPWASKSSPIKPKNMVISETLINVSTPRKGTPKRQARSTAKKERRTPFIEGVVNIQPTEVQPEVEEIVESEPVVMTETVEEVVQSEPVVMTETVDEVMDDAADLSKPKEDVRDAKYLAELTGQSIADVESSLALHAPTANGRKRKAPEEMAVKFKKCSRNTYMANTIFLSDLPMYQTRGDITKIIKEMFGDHMDNVQDMVVMNSTLNKSSGTAYIIFKSYEDTMKAKDVKPIGNVKICLMGSPDHMEGALDTFVDPSTKEYTRNVVIERLLTMFTVIKEQGPQTTADIFQLFPPPATKYLDAEKKLTQIGCLFKREFGGICQALKTEPMSSVFRLDGSMISLRVNTFEEAKELLSNHKEGTKKPHVVYPNPSGLPRNVYDAQHVRAFATIMFEKIKDGMELTTTNVYRALESLKYTDHHGEQSSYKKLIHFWFRSISRFLTILPMAQIFSVNPAGKISLKLRAPTLVRYKLDGYKLCVRDQGPNQYETARLKELEEEEAKKQLENEPEAQNMEA
ncbi:hypothetical protein K7432_015384 [Basidiobolus ranarum]|uniref:RRM domain-containing protein n=1 Tax=Basidiobolus ranarum TaxID=34480 RepID=A0ABR2WG60_9FUNG